MVQQRSRRPGAGRGARGLTVGDELVRPALEAAVDLVAGRTGRGSGAAGAPIIPAPRSLQPFLKLTRLPDRALDRVRRALDDDDELRRRVAGSVDERAVGRAGWLFLSRPPGWKAELAALEEAAEEVRRAADEVRSTAGLARRVGELEEVLERVRSERDGAAAELGTLRTRLHDERRARRRLEADGGRLRQRLAAAEAANDEGAGRVEAADAALGERQDLVRALERVTARAEALEEELVAERAARAAAERRGDAADAAVAAADDAIGGRTHGTPEIDQDALRGAVRAAGEAVADLAAALTAAAVELAPPDPGSTSSPAPAATPSTSRPAGRRSGRRSRPLPPAVHDDSAEAARHLLRIPGALLVVDGYNVTKTARPALDLPGQRRWLEDACAALAARSGVEVELVFDGAGDVASAPAGARRRGVQVRFSAGGVEADEVVIDRVAQVPAERAVVVATDDRRVREGSHRGGANVISAAQLLAVLAVTPHP